MKVASNSFNKGEVTQLLRGRFDLDSLRMACSKMRNFIPRIYGGAFRRPSLIHLDECISPATESRLIPFNFSATTRYLIEVGAGRVRFWNASTGSAESEIDAPWAAGDAALIKHAQINDVMFLTHPDYPTQEINRIGVGSWTIKPVDWKHPAMRDEFLQVDNKVGATYSDLMRTTTEQWPDTGFVSTGYQYHFEVGWVGGAGTKTAVLQIWTGVAWSTVKTFTWTATSYTNTFRYLEPETNMQRMRITFAGPVATASGYARIVQRYVGSTTIDNTLLSLNLTLPQPQSMRTVFVPANTKWRAEMDLSLGAYLHPSSKCILQRLSGSTWVKVADMNLELGKTTLYTAASINSGRTYRFKWTGEPVRGNEAVKPSMAIQSMTFASAPDISLSLGATSGTFKPLTSSAALFDPLHVGAYWTLTHRRTLATAQVVGAVGSFTGTSPQVMVSGQWDFFTYGRWSGTVTLQFQLPDGTWETLRSWVGNTDRNITTTGTVDSGTQMRIVVTGASGSASSEASVPRFVLEAADAGHTALVKVTGYTSPTQVIVDILRPALNTSATRYWAEGAWSAFRGYPRTVSVHEQRLIMAGNKSQPQTLWGSAIGDLRNFEPGILDDMAVSFTLAAQESNPIKWLISQGGILVGTGGEEWLISGGDAAITGSNIQVTRQSRIGSADIQAIMAESTILFVQRGGINVREYMYRFEQQNYVSPIVSQLVEHLTRSGIRAIAQSTNPEQMLWAVTNEGMLLSCSYRREEEVVAWSAHPTAGKVKWVAVVYGELADEVWVTVERNGTHRVERLDVAHWIRLEEGISWHADAAVVRSFDEPEAVIDGLEHLEGLPVVILADGAEAEGDIVEGGAVTLKAPVSHVVVGLAMESLLQPWPIYIDLKEGTTAGRKLKTSRLDVFLHRSGAMQWRDSDTGSVYDLPFRTPYDSMDGPVELFSGEKKIDQAGRHQGDTQSAFLTSSPLPLNVLAVVNTLSINGD